MTAIDIGGSLAGFQFVLAKQGMHVVNVDPGEAAAGLGWAVREHRHERLNRAFRTGVELRTTTLQDAGIAPASVDVVYSISTIEHIPQSEVLEMAEVIAKILKPGGHVVLTVDLFLDLAPFTKRISNQWGTNINISSLAEATGLDLDVGNRSELNGYPEFDPEQVLASLSEFELGKLYPVVAQALVLTKRS